MSTETWIPRSDVYENADAWLVVADVPGVTPESVSLNFEQGLLKLEAGAKGSGWHFLRSWRLPREIDGDGVKADLKNGVLSIRVPKAPTAKLRKITIAEG